MLFEKVTKQHILEGIEDFNSKGIPNGYGPSSTYDLSHEGKVYPPKAIMAYANFRASGRKIESYFSGGIGTDCFKAFDRNGFEILKKMENKELLKNYLIEFSKIADYWFEKQDWFEERFDFYKKFYKRENIEGAEWKDFQEIGNHIHSFNSMAIAKGNALGNMNLPIEEYRRIFLYIVSEEDPINVTINNLYKNYEGNAILPYFSDSSISELIAYAYPDKYVTYNRRDVEALEILGLKLKKVRAEKFGDLFLRYNNLLQPVLEQYTKIVGKRTNATIQLELDQFFSWLYETKKTDKPIKDLINKYKKRIKETKLKEEIYKWEFINNYKGRPNISAENFQEEIKSIKWGNLVYGLTGGVLNHIAREKDEELRDLFKGLFDDSASLESRIKSWDKKMMTTYRKVHGEHSHHQDERAISVYLTLQNPDRFTFYKSSYYSKFCELLGEKPKKKGSKYIHYLELIKDLAKNYIAKDDELLSLVKDNLGDLNQLDGNYLLLAQDILYQILEIEEEVNYWIFQGNPKIFDFEAAIADESLDNFTVSAHKDKIKVGDKVIIWITGSKSGCYALAEIIEEPRKVDISSDDHHWKTDQTTDIKAGIKITHNFFNHPILKKEIESAEDLKNLKTGNQGSNFSATKEEYLKLLDMSKINNTKYWLYAPGQNASKWDEFNADGIAALGWDEIGSIEEFKTKEDIYKALKNTYGGEGSKMNDVAANYEFTYKMNIGDVIIAKKGRSTLLGFGVVSSDYFFDEKREEYKHCRSVDWKLKGNWKVDFSLALKTFTNITGYPTDHPDYETYYELLIGIMKQNDSKINLKEDFKIWLEQKHQNSGTVSSYIKALENFSIIGGFEIFETVNVDLIMTWYEDALEHQSDLNGKYFIEASPSYGKNKFYSASLKKYVEFLNTRGTMVNEESETYKTEGVNVIPLNQILYGPPGTGKTFHTINKALSIIENKPEEELLEENRNNLKKRFNEMLIKDWENPSGQIGFVTFHQSMSYEDFIEGIKPLISSDETVLYDVVPGIFKNINNLAKDNWLDANKGLNEQLSFEEAFINLKEEWEENSDLKFPLKTVGHDYTILGFSKSSIRFKKASGGTSHTLSISTLSDYYYNKKEIRQTGVGIYYPSILNKLNSYKSSINNTKKVKPYVLIIDEINRGNVSQVFGELITLLEEDKRLGATEELELTLPYSKESFTIAPNLYIIGTMNTADRSVEALDTALRRRFSFIEMMPKYDQIDGKEIESIDLGILLKIINDRIELLIDRDHTIGHSYFINVNTIQELASSFNDKIVPLLQEYFYGDYGKIGLVLGEGFVKEVKTKDIAFAKFKYEDSDDFKTPKHELTAVTSENFISAIKTLLGDEKAPSEV